MKSSNMESVGKVQEQSHSEKSLHLDKMTVKQFQTQSTKSNFSHQSSFIQQSGCQDLPEGISGAGDQTANQTSSGDNESTGQQLPLDKIQNAEITDTGVTNDESKTTEEVGLSKIGEGQSTTAWSNKPNFSFVCMLPSKQGKNQKTTGLDHALKSHELLDQSVLRHILDIQAHQIKEFKQVLRLDKIGPCGIPSLWMTRDELLQQNHLTMAHLEEEERISKIHSVVRTHKKWEHEKYFGPSYKRGMNLSTVQAHQLSDFVHFSTEILYQKFKNPPKDDKQIETELNALPSIKQFDQPDQMLFRVMHAEAKLVRLILETHGFQQTESNDWNILWTCNGTSSKAYIYETLNEVQKINHFVNSTELTRKDRFCANYSRMQQKFGRQHFDFMPETYIIPEEFSDFSKAFHSNYEPSHNNLWIVKPSCSSQGKGIFMTDDLQEVPLNESLVVSRYIPNPLLINGLKFDIRLYVLVTSVEPLRIYIYNEGLVRFASEAYNLQSVKSNIYAHLTNYSINKKSENFVQNKTINERDVGNKWSLSALQIHLKKMGINTDLLWDRIYDSVIKSFLSIENSVYQAVKKIPSNANNPSKQNSFDLFGFDIILDTDLKPWILEVNLSPSLAFDSPLDYHIKSNLIVDALNIVGLRKFQRKREVLGKQLKVKQPSVSIATQSQANKDKKKRYPSALNISQGDGQILNKTDNLTTNNHHHSNKYDGIDYHQLERLSKISAKHREILIQTLEEFTRNHKPNFTRIYPAPGSNQYDPYFEQPRHLNKMVYKYLYCQSEITDILQSQFGGKFSLDQTNFTATASTNSTNGSSKGLDSNKSTLLAMKNEKRVQHATFSKGETTQKNRSASLSSMSLQGTGKRQQEEDTGEDGAAETSFVSGKTVQDKVVITGDDILIEYVHRMVSAVRSFPGDIPPVVSKRIESFLTHKVWVNKAQPQSKHQPLYSRIEQRCTEMQDRKKKIFLKGESNTDAKYRDQERQKDEIIREFLSSDLEKMLIQSNHNNQLEVVGILVNPIENTYGVLTKLEKEGVRLQKEKTPMTLLSMHDSFAGDLSASYVTPKHPSGKEKFIQNVEKQQKNNYASQMLSEDTPVNSNIGSRLQTSNQKVAPYYTSQTTSKANLQNSAQLSHKKTFAKNTLDQRFVLPQIKTTNAVPHTHLGSDFSKSSIQLTEPAGSDNSSSYSSKYRSRVQQDSYKTTTKGADLIKKSNTHVKSKYLNNE